MGNRIHINRVVDGFSSHTQMRPRARRARGSADAATLRQRLIAATLEVLAEGSDPRLAQSRAHA
ncbi:MAG TPA: hypothetical protein VMB51_04575 [Solirubrobacteraceae bacterium]|nr:hypothetical protein [Solirubrobacteraceae bacterium]